VTNLVLPLDGYSVCSAFSSAKRVTLIANLFSEQPMYEDLKDKETRI
jgi:hypothetical protein